MGKIIQIDFRKNQPLSLNKAVKEVVGPHFRTLKAGSSPSAGDLLTVDIGRMTVKVYPIKDKKFDDYATTMHWSERHGAVVHAMWAVLLPSRLGDRAIDVMSVLNAITVEVGLDIPANERVDIITQTDDGAVISLVQSFRAVDDSIVHVSFTVE